MSIKPSLVLIGPFVVGWYSVDFNRLYVSYRGGNIVSRVEIGLEPLRIHNAYVDGNKYYYFVYEATERYLEYATALPEGAGQVNELSVPYGCRAGGRFYSTDEDCFEMETVERVVYLFKRFSFKNDADLSTVLTEYRPNFMDGNVVVKWLEKHGIKVEQYSVRPRIVVLRGVMEGVEYGVKYKDVVGFKYAWYYDDPCPTASRIKRFRFYYTSNGEVAAVRDLGDVQLGEITSEDLKSLVEDEVLALAVEYEGGELQELLRRVSVKPNQASLVRCKEEREYERRLAEELRNMKVEVQAWGGGDG
jgi:hypothetical protein